MLAVQFCSVFFSFFLFLYSHFLTPSRWAAPSVICWPVQIVVIHSLQLPFCRIDFWIIFGAAALYFDFRFFPVSIFSFSSTLRLTIHNEVRYSPDMTFENEKQTDSIVKGLRSCNAEGGDR